MRTGPFSKCENSIRLSNWLPDDENRTLLKMWELNPALKLAARWWEPERFSLGGDSQLQWEPSILLTVDIFGSHWAILNSSGRTFDSVLLTVDIFGSHWAILNSSGRTFDSVLLTVDILGSHWRFSTPVRTFDPVLLTVDIFCSHWESRWKLTSIFTQWVRIAQHWKAPPKEREKETKGGKDPSPSKQASKWALE
jgi:hypothetical protein